MESKAIDKELKIYKGSLKEYTEKLWKDKKGDGTVISLGEIHYSIVQALDKRNILLVDTRIIVDQHSATKYYTHPKARKGSTLPISDYHLIEIAIKQPFKIYEDASHGDLVYVYSYPYTKGKQIKIVIQPNYNRNGKTYNNVKSWGIVQNANLNNPVQYKLIWK